MQATMTIGSTTLLLVERDVPMMHQRFGASVALLLDSATLETEMVELESDEVAEQFIEGFLDEDPPEGCTFHKRVKNPIFHAKARTE